MIELKRINDKDLWNSKAEEFPEASFVASWQWGELQEEMGSNFEGYGVYNDSDLVGLVPVSVVNAKRGKYLHIRHAPLIDWDDEMLVHEVIAAMRDIADEHGSWFIRISPLIEDNEKNREMLKLFSFIPSTSHATDAEHTLILDLDKDEDQLLAEMRKNTRYSIRKAEKLGVIVERYDDMSRFEEFWEIFQDAVVRNQWVAYSKNYLKKELEVFLKDGSASMFLSQLDGEYISGSLFTYFNKQSVYHHSGSVTKFRKIPSTYLLQWEAIKYAKSIGMKQHNLWGVVEKDDKDHPWYGLSLYKRGFGGRDREMIHAHDLILSPFAYATRTFEKIENRKNGF